MNRFSCVLTVVFLVVVNLTTAATVFSSEKSSVNVPTTLYEAIELAIQDRVEVQMEEMQVGIKQAKVRETKGAFLPTLSFFGAATDIKNYDPFTGIAVSGSIGNQTISIDVEAVVPKYQVRTSLELNYNLYSGGRDTAALEGAHAKLAAAKYQKNTTLRKVILDVTTAYWALRKAQIAYATAKRWSDYFLSSLKVAEAQLKAGQISEIDKEMANIRLQEQEIVAARTKCDVRDSYRRYRLALGLKHDEVDSDAQHIPQLTDDPEQGIYHAELALQAHPELSKLKADIRAAKALIKSVRAEYLPRLDFFASYEQIGRDEDTFSNALDDFHRNNYIIGMQLSINLFEGFKTWHRVTQAKLEAELAQMRFEQKVKELSESFQEKSLRLAKAMDELVLAKQRLLVSEAKEKVARVEWQAGRYSEQEYQKEQIAVQEDANKVFMAKIDIMLARLHLTLASLD